MENNNLQSNNLIVIRDRKSLEIDGVTRLDSFDSKEFLLETNRGYLHVTGSELSLGSMNMDKGYLVIKGNIDSAKFVNKNKTGTNNKESFFSKLFK